MAAMLGCVLYFCCHVVAGGCWGLLPPPPARRWGDFVPHPPVGVLPAPRQALGCPNTGVLWLLPVPEVEYASVCFSRFADDGQSSHLCRVALPASSLAEAPKFESIAVCRTFLSFRHRLGVFWVQKSSETYYLLLLGSSR